MLALAMLVVDLVDFGDGIVRMAGVVTLLLAIAISWAVVEVAIVRMAKERRGQWRPADLLVAMAVLVTLAEVAVRTA